MELRNKCLTVELYPKEVIEFNIQSTDLVSDSDLTITNSSSIDAAFRIKTTSANAFRITPACGEIKAGTNVKVKFTYTISLETRETLHKFLVVIVPNEGKNLNQVDWGNSIMEYKLWAKLVKAEIKPVRIYNRIEEDKRRITAENDQLRVEIDKKLKKITESKDLNYLTHEKLGSFGVSHMIAFFCLGFVVGLGGFYYN